MDPNASFIDHLIESARLSTPLRGRIRFQSSLGLGMDMLNMALGLMNSMGVAVDRDRTESVLERVLNESLSESKTFERKPRKIDEGLKIKQDVNIFCCICQLTTENKDKVLELKCNHVFHESCITEWIAYKNECPVCKKEVKCTEGCFDSVEETVVDEMD